MNNINSETVPSLGGPFQSFFNMFNFNINSSAESSGLLGKINIDFTGLDIIIVLLIIIAVASFGAYQFLTFKKDEMIKARKGTLFQIKPGLEVTYKKSEKKIRMVRLLETFVSTAGSWWEMLQIVEPTYSFEIHANGIGGYGTYIWVPEDEIKHLPAKMRSLYEQPDTVNNEDEPMASLLEKIADEKGYSKVDGFLTAEYQGSGLGYMPIREWTPDKGEPDDPMEQIYGIFDGLRGNNIAGMMVIVKPTDGSWRNKGLEAIQNLEYDMPKKKGWLASAFSAPSPENNSAPRKKQLDTFGKAQIAALTEKIRQDGFSVVIRIYSSDETTFQLLSNALEKRFKGEYNQLVKTNSNVSIEEMKLRWFEKSNLILSLGEISSIYHFADSETKAERLQRGGSSTAAPDENLFTFKDEDYDPFKEVSAFSER